jgi:hypothetical protein
VFVRDNAGGVPGHVGVLEGTEQDNLAEVTETALFRQLINEGLIQLLRVLHLQLLQTVDILEFHDRP